VYRWAEHTGELELEIEAPDEQGVYADAVAALAELLGDDGGDAEATTRRVAVEAADRPRLLAELLAELAFLAEVDGFVAERLEHVDAAEDRLAAVVRGRPGSPPHLVKAVTYHRLAFEPAAGGFRATVVLDV
jgi:SHS2 domain-containing protein